MSDERWRDETLRRPLVARIYEVGDDLVVVAPDGEQHRLSGDSAALAHEVLDLLRRPLTGQEIVAHLEALSGGPLPRPQVIGELLALLRKAGAVEPYRASAPVPRRPDGGSRVVLGLTGAIGSMLAPALVKRLQARGHAVWVMATADALRFVAAEALEMLTHRPVVASMWPDESGDSEVPERLRVPHIELAQWADAVLVCPASATTISRLATGDYSSVVSSVAQATVAPVIVAPSMNPAMYDSPAVQRNLAQLVGDGMHVVHTAYGMEVAESPGMRVLRPGAAPPDAAVADVLDAILRATGRGDPRAPATAEEWDALYRDRPPAELGWHSDEVDADLAAAVERLAPTGATVLDVGTGLGSLAAALAGRGHRVVATDISAVALRRAQERFADAGVVWVRDDITATALGGRFEIVIDRACLHLLSPRGATRWAEAMRSLVAAGGTLLLKTLADGEARARAARSWTADALTRLLGPEFSVVSTQPSTLPGPDGAPVAHLFELRRA